FRTELETDGAGNLYVVGGFDPTLTAASLRDAARALRAKGITELHGDVVLDTSRLRGDPTPDGFARFSGQRWSYLTPPSALAVDKDLFSVGVKPGSAAGAPARIAAD